MNAFLRYSSATLRESERVVIIIMPSSSPLSVSRSVLSFVSTEFHAINITDVLHN